MLFNVQVLVAPTCIPSSIWYNRISSRKNHFGMGRKLQENHSVYFSGSTELAMTCEIGQISE